MKSIVEQSENRFEELIRSVVASQEEQLHLRAIGEELRGRLAWAFEWRLEGDEAPKASTDSISCPSGMSNDSPMSSKPVKIASIACGMLHLALCLAAPNSTYAQDQTNSQTLVANYTPFLNGRPWPLVPVIAYVRNASNVWVHPAEPKKFPTLQEIHDEESDFATVVMRLPDGSTLKTYNALILGPYLASVFSGDFNKDGIPDFMAIKPTTACGIAAEQCIGLFAFSEDKSYRFTRIDAWGLGPHSLVIDPSTKSFRLMHTTFRGGESLDGRNHNFWVHRFFKWENRSFRLDSDMLPIWIQFLHRPNHEATKLLSPELKMKLWMEDSESDDRIEF